METNNMKSVERAHTQSSYRTGNVWSVTSQSVKLCQVHDSLNPAATNWLEPSQQHGRGGGEWMTRDGSHYADYVHKVVGGKQRERAWTLALCHRQ